MISSSITNVAKMILAIPFVVKKAKLTLERSLGLTKYVDKTGVQ